MREILAAFATDNGMDFIDRHFGDAQSYEIYRISVEKWEYVGSIKNTTEDDEDDGEHGDLKKAGGIASLLKKEGVQVTVAPVYGPNLKRIKSRFLCIITGKNNIEDALSDITGNFSEVLSEMDKGEGRNHLTL